MYAMLCAVSAFIIPLGIGLYGFDILSASKSAAWFNAFDAAFTIAIVNPAWATVKYQCSGIVVPK